MAYMAGQHVRIVFSNILYHKHEFCFIIYLYYYDNYKDNQDTLMRNPRIRRECTETQDALGSLVR